MATRTTTAGTHYHAQKKRREGTARFLNFSREATRWRRRRRSARSPSARTTSG